MRITVVGRSPSWPDAGGACSGYLVEDGETCLLVDCGSGVFSKLREVRDYVDIDAVLITHMHADHFLDLIPFGCALSFSPRCEPAGEGEERPAGAVRPQLLVPPGAAEVLHTITSAGGQAGLLDEAFAITEYDPSQPQTVGTLSLRLQPVPHYVPANAVQVRCPQGGRFTFGADHGPTDALDDFAHASDLLILEATLADADADAQSDEPRGHLTAAEAGEHATRCAAKRLVLTHISDELDWARAVADARRSFAGPVEVARGGAVYEV